MLSQNTIDAVRNANIVDIVRKKVDLKKAGVNYTGCCPFHNERSPSFVVNPVKNMFKCFGCGKGGDVITFIQELERLDFIAACEEIATLSNITIEYEHNIDDVKYKELKDEKESMYAVLKFAQQKYVDALGFTPDAKQYLLDRNFTEETIIDWGLGYAPPKHTYIKDLLKDSGKTYIAVKADLIKSKEDRNYDTFGDRIIIPIRDQNGRVVGFGGRILKPNPDTAKYLNPSETLIYSKSKILFGLSQASTTIRKVGFAILTEGYTDVIRLHQSGFDVAVASCGTALTSEQGKLLKRYCNKVVLMRDGDSAGLKAISKDIPILLAESLNVNLFLLPDGEDPDSYFNEERFSLQELIAKTEDALIWQCKQYFAEVVDVNSKSEKLQQVVELLLLVKQSIKRDEYMKQIAPLFSMKPTELKKIYDRVSKENTEKIIEAEAKEEGLPGWMNASNVFQFGFDQLFQEEKGYKRGVYFKNDSSGVFRVSNFTIKPLYFLNDATNPRRLVEVSNSFKTSVIELSTRAMVGADAFEMLLMDRGSFYTEPNFQKQHFKRLVAWLSDNMKAVYELKTLGWQPEGFFAFSDKVYHGENLLDYNEMGVVDVDDKSYISVGISNIQADFRQENNSYENDLYLKHVATSITFQQWSERYCKVYKDNGALGISFALITAFKDICSHVTKIPHLYCYGPKGSGKSDFAESLTWLYFSGKNSDGKLIQGFNLNPGQSTIFSFFSRLERFRNCPALFNEFDENVVEEYKFGAFKAAYDGEGREVGDGETGKARKTRIQKVQCTCIIVGQYLSVRDDGSILSRSLTAPFGITQSQTRTNEDIKLHAELKQWEENGLSGIVCEILKHRDVVKSKLKIVFLEEYNKLADQCKTVRVKPETRILKNYTLCVSMVRIFESLVKLPFTYAAFYNDCFKTIVNHTGMLKDNSSLNQFWKMVEFMFDQGVLRYGQYFSVREESSLEVQSNRTTENLSFIGGKRVLYLRFSGVYSLYSKMQRERSGKSAMDEETLLTYLKDQPYYLGLVSVFNFSDKRTSCYAVSYDDLNIVLEKSFDMEDWAKHPKNELESKISDVPF
jgi:DNA primase catalytic core